MAEAVKKIFSPLDLEVTNPGKDITDEISAQRNDAFRQARATLLKSDSKSYAQQFEGLYAMMRGLAITFWFGCFYYLGWAGSYCHKDFLQWIARSFLIGGLGAAGVLGFISNSINVSRGDEAQKNKKRKIRIERVAGLLLTLVALSSGALIGWRKTMTPAQAIAFFFFGLGAFLCAVRCYGAYTFFTKEFARAVWSDFLNLQISPAEPHEKQAGKK